jgi:hypothetical protein
MASPSTCTCHDGLTCDDISCPHGLPLVLDSSVELPAQLVLFDVPICGVYPMDVDEANTLLVTWGHRLGKCHRPFGQQAFCLRVQGQPISLAISASIVSATVAEYVRQRVVECARLCSHPQASWANRLMLRLWREVCAPLWPYWSVDALVSYSQNAHHSGNLYRFDGWQRYAENCGSSGGGSWSHKRSTKDAVYGRKTLWLYRVTPRRETRHA